MVVIVVVVVMMTMTMVMREREKKKNNIQIKRAQRFKSIKEMNILKVKNRREHQLSIGVGASSSFIHSFNKQQI